jgi:hypothetical protein
LVEATISFSAEERRAVFATFVILLDINVNSYW